MKEIVVVFGEKCEITVQQKSKSVWVAVGDYLGKSVRVQGRSRTTAVANWRQAAQYEGSV